MAVAPLVLTVVEGGLVDFEYDILGSMISKLNVCPRVCPRNPVTVPASIAAN
jgi:hypothetical protein